MLFFLLKFNLSKLKEGHEHCWTVFMTIILSLPWLLYDSTSTWSYPFLLYIGPYVIKTVVLEEVFVMALLVASNRIPSQTIFIKMKFIGSYNCKIMGHKWCQA